jgi:CRISPR-associated protein Cmr3
LRLEYVRIAPIDVLYLRGNRLFADGGDAEPVMPPWPSLFAGALRSRMLVDRQEDEDAFRAGGLGGMLGDVIGRGAGELGTFRVAFGCLETDYGRAYPPPADVVVTEEAGESRVHRLRPERAERLGVVGSFALPRAPVLPVSSPRKPLAGHWLSEAGLLAWQRGECPPSSALVDQRDLWKEDPRLGIALDAGRRSAAEGMLYTTRTVSLAPGVRFLVAIAGGGGLVPDRKLVRLGGDGRGATVERWAPEHTAGLPWHRIPATDRFTMLLVAPCLSPAGWLPPGTEARDGQQVWTWGSLRARVVAAAVGRPQVISGWDLPGGHPKPAVRVIPAGTVYWMERMDGPLDALSDALERGLWPDEAAAPARRAEGFNSVWFGEWSSQDPEG